MAAINLPKNSNWLHNFSLNIEYLLRSASLGGAWTLANIAKKVMTPQKFDIASRELLIDVKAMLSSFLASFSVS